MRDEAAARVARSLRGSTGVRAGFAARALEAEKFGAHKLALPAAWMMK